MKRALKVLISVALVASVFFVLTGCGKTQTSETAKTEAVKEIKIGLLNCMTGAVANAGGIESYRGQDLAIELANAKLGAQGKYKLIPVVADTQSKPDVAKAEAERLIKQEKVAMIMGIFSSSLVGPVAEICEQNKVVFVDMIATDDSFMKDKHNNYVFRMEPGASTFGKDTVDFVNGNLKKFGVEKASDLKVAVIYEDSVAGVSRAESGLEYINKYGMKVVAKEKYNKAATDLTDLVTKLKAASPDVIFHASYVDDCAVFLAAAKKQGLKTKAIVGQGGLYISAQPKIDTIVGKGTTEYIMEASQFSAKTEFPNSITPELFEVHKNMLAKYQEKYKKDPNNTCWLTFDFAKVVTDYAIPAAFAKGDINSETLKDAMLGLNIPANQTGVGYGVKFAPSADQYAGQDTEAFLPIKQFIKGEWKIVWPENIKQADAIIPIPKDSFLGN